MQNNYQYLSNLCNWITCFFWRDNYLAVSILTVILNRKMIYHRFFFVSPVDNFKIQGLTPLNETSSLSSAWNCLIVFFRTLIYKFSTFIFTLVLSVELSIYCTSQWQIYSLDYSWLLHQPYAFAYELFTTDTSYLAMVFLILSRNLPLEIKANK